VISALLQQGGPSPLWNGARRFSGPKSGRRCNVFPLPESQARSQLCSTVASSNRSAVDLHQRTHFHPDWYSRPRATIRLPRPRGTGGPGGCHGDSSYCLSSTEFLGGLTALLEGRLRLFGPRAFRHLVDHIVLAGGSPPAKHVGTEVGCHAE
jgi:hypothetical protein